jgi:hypothetical protein
MITFDEIKSYLASRVPSVTTFVLRRKVDVTGISGTGVVADGAVFPDGRVATRWRGGTTGVAQTCAWDNLVHVRRIHGHDGNTELELLATGALVVEQMDRDWRDLVLEAIEDALIDEIPGARERRDGPA